MCKLVLVLGLVIFINQLQDLEAKPRNNGGRNCRCQSTIVWDKDTQQNIGNCLTKYHNKYWCYVSRGACTDVRESRKRPGIYYSYAACQRNQQPQPQPFIDYAADVDAEIDYYDYNY